jgi:hypothetical protein
MMMGLRAIAALGLGADEVKVERLNRRVEMVVGHGLGVLLVAGRAMSASR